MLPTEILHGVFWADKAANNSSKKCKLMVLLQETIVIDNCDTATSCTKIKEHLMVHLPLPILLLSQHDIHPWLFLLPARSLPAPQPYVLDSFNGTP